MLFLMLGAFLILAWTWRGVSIDALEFEKAKLAGNLEELQRQQKHLKSNLTTLRSFARIDKLAREKLGMVYADQAPRTLIVPGLTTERPVPKDNNNAKSFAFK
jgi:cell division protein FtsB